MLKKFGPVLFSVLLLASSTLAVNVIEGTIYDPQRRPVPNLWVELQNEFNITYGRTRTSSAGRYSFTGMRAGRYQVVVYTTGTEFAEATETVEIVNITTTASDAAYQDIRLRYKKEAAKIDNGSDTVFAQTVPDDARKLCKSGVRSLSEKDLAAGRRDLDAAITIFPTYYDALDALGGSYVETGDFQKSLKYLLAAIDQNQRSFSSTYALAYAAYKLGQIPDAVRVASAAVVLKPSSPTAVLLYGTVLRMSGDNATALKVLTKAEELTKASPIPEVHWQLALLLNHMGRNKEAADHLDKYLQLSPAAPNRAQVETLSAKLRTQGDAKAPEHQDK